MTNLQDPAGRRALLAVIVTVGTLMSSPSFGGPAYDGVWSVLVHTEKGDCDPGYRYPIRLHDGVRIDRNHPPRFSRLRTTPRTGANRQLQWSSFYGGFERPNSCW